MGTTKARAGGLLSTVLGIAAIGVALVPTAAAAALDSNPKTRELKETQQYSTVGDVSDGDCGDQFDPEDGIIWHFIADNTVVGSQLVSWSASFAATDGGPVVETVTGTPEVKIVGNGKTYHFYTQSQNLYLANAVATFDLDQTQVDMQLSHICGESVPGSTTTVPETTTTVEETTTTVEATTTTLVANETTTTEATVLPTTLVRDTTTTDPSTTSSLRTEVSGVTQTRQLPRTGSNLEPLAYAGIFLVGLGLVLQARHRTNRSS